MFFAKSKTKLVSQAQAHITSIHDNKNLCRLAISIRSGIEDQPEDPQLVRLDNMLVAEGVQGPENVTTAEAGTDQADYKQKLQQIRHTYHEELNKYEEVVFIYLIRRSLIENWIRRVKNSLSM